MSGLLTDLNIKPETNMTMQNITKSLVLLAACSAMTATAGVTPAPAPAPAPAPTGWTGSVTLGYDTDYIYRGVQVLGDGGYAKDLVTGILDLNYQINDRLAWNINLWYGTSAAPETDYDELDIYTRLLYKVNDQFSFGPSIKYYYYPFLDASPLDEQLEFGIEGVWTPCAGTTVNLGAFYETESEAYYLEAGISHVFKINDTISLVPGAVISYLDRDATVFGPDVSDFNHAAIYLKAPITMKSNVTLTPYIAYNFALDAIDTINPAQSDDFYGGISLAVGF